MEREEREGRDEEKEERVRWYVRERGYVSACIRGCLLGGCVMRGCVRESSSSSLSSSSSSITHARTITTGGTLGVLGLVGGSPFPF